MTAQNSTPAVVDPVARGPASALLRPWLLLLAWAGLVSALERVAWGWSGSELSTVDRIVDSVLLVTVLLGLLAAGWLSIRSARRARDRVWLGVLAAFLGPIATVAMVTAIVHDVDGGFLLVTAVPVSWIVSSAAALGRRQALASLTQDEGPGSS